MALLAWGIGTWAAAADPAVPATAKLEKPATPRDFKLGIAFHGIRKAPITTAELVVRGGVAYYFASEAPEEVLIIDPAAPRIELVDLDRKVQSEISFTKLDE